MFSFRNRTLQKLKKFYEKEYTIVDTELKGGKNIETFNFVLVAQEGEKFRCRSLGSHNYWKQLHQNPPIGKRATVRYLNLSNVKGVPEKAVVKAIRDYE